ncbi:MAG TPA: Na+/H+ antiporter NhaA [Gaiellaceae bacterium]|nr:Na+/H+ antiporter NhaA [Gaiellaceae bacterium]
MAAAALTGQTEGTKEHPTPLRTFLRTETGSAALLLGATVAALVWVNAAGASYARVWSTDLAISVGHQGVTQDLRLWINNGLMVFFFFVVGLEARREYDLGELRERRRVILPLVAGSIGLALPVLIYLAFNAGKPSAHGWGTTMSTDTAFALGMLALVGPNLTGRIRAFMLTVLVVDDIAALLVIATAYTNHLEVMPLLVGLALFAVAVTLVLVRMRWGLVYFGIGVAVWVAVQKSGVDPIIVGLAMGLLTWAYPAERGDLERASDLFRRFREQPTPELERVARFGLRAAVSPNERLQGQWHPWSSYAIVPLFALANAGVHISGSFLAHAFTSSITLGIVVGYVVGKPVAVVGGSWLVSRASRQRLRLPVGWGAAAGTGAVAGIGFTVALLIASLAFTGQQLEEAKLGILSAALCASVLGYAVFRAIRALPRPLRARALLGTAESIVDLAVAVDPEHDHVRGDDGFPVTLLEYGDFECPYCGRAEPVVRELLAEVGDLRYVWRHLPLTDVHPNAFLAAEAAEAAGDQGKFWEMRELLFQHQDALQAKDLVAYAEQLGLDVDRFGDDLREHRFASRVADDVESADLSGVAGTPTFFVNDRRHYGAYDIDALKQAVHVARARTLLDRPAPV